MGNVGFRKGLEERAEECKVCRSAGEDLSLARQLVRFDLNIFKTNLGRRILTKKGALGGRAVHLLG